MEIIIARHAAAEPGDGKPDELRELTKEGIAQARLLGQVVSATLGIPAEVWTSPLRRARQTAELAAAAWGRGEAIREVPELAPGGDVEHVRWLLTRSGAPLVFLAGHMPDVGSLASAMLGLVGSMALRTGSFTVVRTNDPLHPAGLAMATVLPDAFEDILAGRTWAPWMMRNKLRVTP